MTTTMQTETNLPADLGAPRNPETVAAMRDFEVMLFAAARRLRRQANRMQDPWRERALAAALAVERASRDTGAPPAGRRDLRDNPHPRVLASYQAWQAARAAYTSAKTAEEEEAAGRAEWLALRSIAVSECEVSCEVAYKFEALRQTLEGNASGFEWRLLLASIEADIDGSLR